jgi:NAD dependent epimerase/dehydratase family enzyme
MDRSANELRNRVWGTGFVGRRVVRYLCESGATVRVASRHPRRAEGDDVEQIAAVIWYGVTQGPSNPTSASDL